MFILKVTQKLFKALGGNGGLVGTDGDLGKKKKKSGKVLGLLHLC